jgi:hypothetical protein
MREKLLGILLFLVGALVIAASVLKRGYLPGAPLFPDFLLGIGVFLHGVTYMILGFLGPQAGPNPARKWASGMFLIYYLACLAWMLLAK